MQSESSGDERLPVRKIFIGLLLIEFFLVCCYWVDVLTGESLLVLHGLFDLDGEGNIPTWFSSAQLLVVGLTLWNIALRQQRGTQGRHSTPPFFALAGCGAVYVSLDETAQIHERVTAWMGQRYVDWLPRWAGSHLLLVLVAVGLIVILTRFFGPELLTIYRNHRRLVTLAVVGIGIGLTGGMGVETLGYELLHGERTSLWYKAEVTVEEFMEMLGASLILLSALQLKAALAAQGAPAKSQPRRSAALLPREKSFPLTV